MGARRVAALGVLQKASGIDSSSDRQLSRLRPRQQCLPADEPARDKIDGRGEGRHAASAMALVEHDKYGRAADAHEHSEEELTGCSPRRARRVAGQGKGRAREVGEVAKADDCSRHGRGSSCTRVSAGRHRGWHGRCHGEGRAVLSAATAVL